MNYYNIAIATGFLKEPLIDDKSNGVSIACGTTLIRRTFCEEWRSCGVYALNPNINLQMLKHNFAVLECENCSQISCDNHSSGDNVFFCKFCSK